MDSSSLKIFELGKLVLSSSLLHSSWSKISEIHKTGYCQNQDSGLGFKRYDNIGAKKYTLVVFVAPPIQRNSSVSTGLSASQKHPFHFLSSEKISSFSLHTPAFELFTSACNDKLLALKSELLELLESNKPVIITGAALGGAVASLFTLWLLETIDPQLKRPLCITFGSPLIGDASLQQILENSVRNSCFLHVAEAAKPPFKGVFKPFGTFLICYDSECICIEDPEAVMELLIGVDTDDQIDWRDYGHILQSLDQSSMADSRLMIDDVIKRMDERAWKKMRFDQLKRLNNMKILMAYIEGYKKKSKIAKIGYYDRFKNGVVSMFDMDVKKLIKELNQFWKSMVEDVEKKPQSEKSSLKSRCRYAGNNYRRMIEPLDIAEHYLNLNNVKTEYGTSAEYYLNSLEGYRTSGRSRHYVMLEKWFKAEKIDPVRYKNRDLSDLLTFDSCFWADVEEALIVTNLLKTDERMRDDHRAILAGKIMRFEEYMWGLIDKREVSPEIFLEESSFMRWWKEYKPIRGSINPSPSEFTKFMNTWKYESYGQPKVEF